MNSRIPLHVLASTLTLGLVVSLSAAEKPKHWPVHDKKRPQPKIVKPGERPSDPPSDAIVLFDGKDLSKWQIASAKGGEPKWKVEDGAMVIVPRTGSLQTKQKFGDCQLHIEWKAIPGTHANSGIFFMMMYELQIFDSYQNKQWIYADGIAASTYGQEPPLVNACRKPGEWQTFDVIFERPRFDASGKLTKAGIMTVLHNGVLVQNHSRLHGFTVHAKPAVYKPHAEKLPLMLQDHGNPVAFRNIWIRPLE